MRAASVGRSSDLELRGNGVLIAVVLRSEIGDEFLNIPDDARDEIDKSVHVTASLRALRDISMK